MPLVAVVRASGMGQANFLCMADDLPVPLKPCDGENGGRNCSSALM
ncbi:MAG: hypothetical protein J0L84_02585 [Verrucomicrobia bacterium]|nr:hypothetical protein [Verrucomicrobiota bacterium]